MKPLAPIFLLAIFVFFPTFVAAEPPAEERKWLEQVLFGSGSERDKAQCHRWARTPRVALIRASAEQKKVAEEVIKHINEALAGTPIFKLDLRREAAAEADADVKIHFAPEKELPAVAQKYDFKFARGNRGFYWAWWNERHEMTKAIILIADELKGGDLRSMLLKEIVQSLGLAFESPVYSDSIFYRDGPHETRATHLSPRDRRLIALYHSRIKPGSKLSEVQKEFGHW